MQRARPTQSAGAQLIRPAFGGGSRIGCFPHFSGLSEVGRVVLARDLVAGDGAPFQVRAADLFD